jgi:hypothetical protein
MPKNIRSSNVKWLTPRAFWLWRDVGLRGYGADGHPDRSWRGRNDGRDAAFADVLFTSGLRRREAGTLLTIELPDMATVRAYYPGRVAAAVAKTSDRFFYVSRPALMATELYRVTTRAEAVRKARPQAVTTRWRSSGSFNRSTARATSSGSTSMVGGLRARSTTSTTGSG